LWFLLTLFWCFVATRLLAYIDKPVFHVLVLIAATCMSLYVRTNIRLGLNYFVFVYVYFYWGYVVAIYRDKLSKLFRKRMMLLFIVVWISSNALEYFANGSLVHYLRVYADQIDYLANVSFVLLIYSLLQKLTEHNLVRENVFVNSMNKYSYGIYIFHAWLISVFFMRNRFYSHFIYQNAVNHPVIFPITMFFVVFLLSMLISHLLLKVKFTRFLIG
jgi:hypothetical protein